MPEKMPESFVHAPRSRVHPRLRRSTLHLGAAATFAVIGLVAVASPALAHANLITATSSCSTLNGVVDYQVTWNIANDWNLPERAVVTSTTGGLVTLSQASFTIPASGNGSGGTGRMPYESITMVQTLPQSVSGTIFLDVSGTYSDNFPTSNVGYAVAPTNCPPAPPTTTTAAAQPVVSAIASLAPPTTVPSLVQSPVSPTTTTVPSPPAKHKVGHSATSLKRAVVHVAAGLGRPTLLAGVLPQSKPHPPITKAATFTG